MNKQEFPSIHFESSLYHGEIANTEDLKRLFQLYEGIYSKIEFLNKVKAKYLEGLGEDKGSFGLKNYNIGKSLKVYLEEHSIEI